MTHRERWSRARWLRPAIAAAAALLACAPAAVTRAKDGGAAMTTTGDGVSVRKLGDQTPRIEYVGFSGRDFVDPSPIVLWAGHRPAAILHLEVETRGRKAVHKIAPVERGVRLAGFPVEFKVEVPRHAKSEDEVDGPDNGALMQADVDGDGVQELVVPRLQGGVSVHALRGKLAEYPSPAAGPGGARYKRYLAHVMSLGGRDVVYVLSVNAAPAAPAAPERNLLLRVDGRGVTRVQLEGLEKAEILALGAVQRPGSQDVDELLVVTADGAKDAALGRHRPDGTRIEPARRLYVRPSRPCAFRFVPRSTRAVLEVAGGVLILSPDQPANWIREVKASGGVRPEDLEYHFVAELESADPKMVYGVDDGLWAVNRDGTCFAPAGGGRWVPLAKPGPYLRVPVPAGEKLWFVWAAPGEKLFAVSSGERGTRPLTHEEWGQAADRYLPADEAAAFRKRRTPSLEGFHPYRDMSIKEEQQERGDVGPIRTVEEWKRLLPQSYAEVLKYDATRHDVEVASRLRDLRDEPRLAAKAPDPAGLRAFLESIQVPARTTFMAIEALSVNSVTIPGSPMRLLDTQVRTPVEYQLHDGRITAVLTLEKGDAEGKASPAFHLVGAPLAARR